MRKSIKYRILSLLLAFGAAVSCVHDPVDPDFGGGSDDDAVLAEIQSGYSLSLQVTLDKMGGAAATKADLTIPELEELEDYIDPEKFRVLFFDHNEKFLFESKSRWVKILDERSGHTSWFVSIPLFSYGNDMGYGWDWEYIREALTKNSFKIAILANRPNQEWCPDFKNAAGIDAHWFDNSGPHWTGDNAAYSKNTANIKSLFDIHHCQYDPVYTGKSWVSNKNRDDGIEGFYEFVMGYDANAPDKERLTMGATSSWVDWTSTGFDSKRCPIPPSYDHPIPMYGVQEFAPIPKEMWTHGTPFNLSSLAGQEDSEGYTQKSISLLRSVVKLELIIPRSLVTNGLEYVSIWYPNIYSRCEPMDIWTPTEDLWKTHGSFQSWNAGQNCEWVSIMNYGPIARAGDPTKDPNSDPEEPTNSDTIKKYKERISWLYGAWRSRWNFVAETHPTSSFTFAEEDPSTTPYPHIFNPCIQRNTNIVCDKRTDFSDSQNYHYIVYLGERNINDPSSLDNMGNEASGQTTIMCWSVFMNGKVYNIPITDYAVAGNPALSLLPGTPEQTDLQNGKPTKIITNYNFNGNGGGKNDWKTYGYTQWIHNGYQTTDYQPGSNSNKVPITTEQLPWPLLRNHVYRLTLAAGTRADGGFAISTEDMHSETIKFY